MSAAVFRPKLNGFFESEPRLGEVLINAVSQCAGIRQVLLAAIGERDAFRMLKVIANGGLKFVDRWVAVVNVRGHGFVGNVDELARFFGGRNHVAGRDQQARFLLNKRVACARRAPDGAVRQ